MTDLTPSFGERAVALAGESDRTDLAAFLTRALRLDEAAVVRLRRRGDDVLSAWIMTGFDVLAARIVRGTVHPADLCVAADSLRTALTESLGTAKAIDPGWAMDSAWRGALPPDEGFAHVDDVPARVLVELAQQGVALTRDAGAQGPPASLLAQEVLEVSGGETVVGVPMRMVFALGAMGFVPTTGRDSMAADDIAADEVVRVRASNTWIRLDARYGSVYLRRSGGLGLTVL
ncbi:hypothetical protein MWU77_16475 [Rhodococcus sp. F64268]|uniref:hypothetical protein n=1 Tax=Rhodococcus sp. F64268 TaxID=2926402 RepID=UPI001FF55A05|nr:hypothetical protein [Rhodococcus sp. F64268]MCK0092374.1 hypothetical protein [Rhodococcus sp. F64268]